MRLLWTPKANQVKLGPIPTALVGSTQADTRASCDGCPLLGPSPGKSYCYAWSGWTSTAARKTYKLAAAGRDRSCAWALGKRHRAARAVRVGSIGDPARADRAALYHDVDACRAEGLAVLGYTQFWSDADNQDLRFDLLASCATLEEVDAARAGGWAASVVLEGPGLTTPAGGRVLVCPAVTHAGRVTCNTCRLCDARNPAWRSPSGPAAIGFPAHGNGVMHGAEKRPSARHLPMLQPATT